MKNHKKIISNFKEKEGVIKLNLGCYKDIRKNFLNIDIFEKNADIKADVSNLYMFKDNSVDFIYAAHILEHFPAKDTKEIKSAINVLKEWHRILKNGRKLQIKVPDFDDIIDMYQKEKKGIKPKFATEPREKYFPLFNYWLLGNTEPGNKHYCIYTKDILKKMLVDIGFKKIIFDKKQHEYKTREYLEIDLIAVK